MPGSHSVQALVQRHETPFLHVSSLRSGGSRDGMRLTPFALWIARGGGKGETKEST